MLVPSWILTVSLVVYTAFLRVSLVWVFGRAFAFEYEVAKVCRRLGKVLVVSLLELIVLRKAKNVSGARYNLAPAAEATV